MKNKLPMIMGFTLVEILIVIGILGVLATTLVITLNPIEVQKKSRDMKRLKDLSEINSFLVQYIDKEGKIGPADSFPVTYSINSNNWIDSAIWGTSKYKGPPLMDPLCGSNTDCSAERKVVNKEGKLAGPYTMEYYIRTDGTDYSVAVYQESLANSGRINGLTCAAFVEINTGEESLFSSACDGK